MAAYTDLTTEPARRLDSDLPGPSFPSEGGVVFSSSVLRYRPGLPLALKKITVIFEKHVDFGNVQDSMLKKLFLARVINTGLMIFLVTKYSEMMDFKTLNQVCVARSFRGDDPPLSR